MSEKSIFDMMKEMPAPVFYYTGNIMGVKGNPAFEGKVWGCSFGDSGFPEWANTPEDAVKQAYEALEEHKAERSSL